MRTKTDSWNFILSTSRVFRLFKRYIASGFFFKLTASLLEPWKDVERVSPESAFLSSPFSCVPRSTSGPRWLSLKFPNRPPWAPLCSIYTSRTPVTDVSTVGDVRVRKHVTGKRANWKIKDSSLSPISHTWSSSLTENKKVSSDPTQNEKYYRGNILYPSLEMSSSVWGIK